MKIHEYQAKEVLRQYAIPTPRGKACFSVTTIGDVPRFNLMFSLTIKTIAETCLECYCKHSPKIEV